MTLQQNVKTNADQIEKEYNRAVKELDKGNEVPLKSFAVAYSDLPLAQAMAKEAEDMIWAKHMRAWALSNDSWS